MDEQVRTKRQMQAEHTKLQIFNAAMRLLEKQPFESITVRDIVREANVSVGSFYNAYRTKLDVFYETYQVADRYFDQEVRSRLTQETACEKIQTFFEEYAVYSSEISLFALTKVLYNSSNKCFHRHSPRGMQAILTELMQQARDSGELRTDQTAGELARFFMVCVRGVVYDWCISDGAYDLKDQIRAYVQRLLRAYQ